MLIDFKFKGIKKKNPPDKISPRVVIRKVEWPFSRFEMVLLARIALTRSSSLGVRAMASSVRRLGNHSFPHRMKLRYIDIFGSPIVPPHSLCQWVTPWFFFLCERYAVKNI